MSLQSASGLFAQSEWSEPNSRRRIDFRVQVSEGEAWGIKCSRDGVENEITSNNFWTVGLIGPGLMQTTSQIGHSWTLGLWTKMTWNEALRAVSVNLPVIRPYADRRADPEYPWIYCVIFTKKDAGAYFEIWNEGKLFHEWWAQE